MDTATVTATTKTRMITLELPVKLVVSMLNLLECEEWENGLSSNQEKLKRECVKQGKASDIGIRKNKAGWWEAQQ